MDTTWMPEWFLGLFRWSFSLPEGVPWLTLLLWFPLFGAIATLVFRVGQARTIAAVFAGITMVLSFLVYLIPRFGEGSMADLTESYVWLDVLNVKISYILVLDELSILMVALTGLLVFLVTIFADKNKPSSFFALILAMEVGLMGVYLAQDFFMFFIFWEVTLIPMYFMIANFGGPRRHYASMKFLIYTHIASMVMLIGIFALVFQAGAGGTIDFSFAAVAAASFTPAFQTLVFGLLFFGFAVKMPVVPFHTWLPDAHVEAPTEGSVLLAAVMLKMGSYGIIRICLELEAGAQAWQTVMIVVGLIAIVYGAYACIAQKDLKKMIAYSSISHMGMVMLSIAVLTKAGIAFAVFQMFAHGLISAALFMVAGIVGHNAGTREIPLLGGLAKRMPKYAGFVMVAFLASLGLPGLIGFAAEFGIIYSFYVYLESTGMIWAILFVLLGLMLTAGYYMWAMQRTLFGRETTKIDVEHVHDVNRTETAVLTVICLLIVLFGIIPGPIVDIAHGAAEVVSWIL